jgi:anti-sigma B factor antagonist
MALSISAVDPVDGTVVLLPAGELDLGTAEAMRDAIARALASGTAWRVVVDLHAVTFLDSTGIRVLIEGRRLADQVERGFLVRNAGGMVREVLRITGVLDYLGTASDQWASAGRAADGQPPADR